MQLQIAIAMVGLLLLVPSGCALKPDIQTKTPFSSKDFEAYKAKGNGKIYGQTFLKTRGGDVKLAAGNTVALWPAPTFMREAMTLREGGYNVTNYTQEVVREILPYKRDSIGDAQGNFDFTDLAPGDYMLEVVITWEVAGSQTGGVVRKFVTLGEGQAMKVILTQ